MTARTILTLANGKGIDLVDPKPSDIDFFSIAEHLGKEKRFNGATSDVEYSVAEHCCRGADAILADTEDRTLAAYFLLHDAHEAFLKDDTTPKKEALAHIALHSFGVVSDTIMQTFNFLTYRIDSVIHEAAGMAWPMPSEIQKQVKKYDIIMFVTEWRDLMHNAPHPNWAPYSGIKPLDFKITMPWPWASARAGWLLRANRLLPSLCRREKAEA